MRVTKPQPPLLSRVLTQKIRKRVERTESVQASWEEAIPGAELEDEWEKSMASLLEQEDRARADSEGKYGNRNGNRRAVGLTSAEAREASAIRDEYRAQSTFRQTVWLYSIQHVQDLLTKEREDQIARADAMRNLIEEETKLAEQEKAQRSLERRKRWEAKMLELHGEGWRKLFPNLKES